ncbi:MAG: hypothetical protein FJ280_18475 [Planctomycetes bacterium]|nr:hypothetical protein [Planctomycetota bacterium]
MRINELPQIYNVVHGEMSLVGPRPQRPFFVACLPNLYLHYATRVPFHADFQRATGCIAPHADY